MKRTILFRLLCNAFGRSCFTLALGVLCIPSLLKGSWEASSLGPLWLEGSSLVYHADQGWLHLDGDDFPRWGYDFGLRSWVWLDATTYPALYAAEEGGWIYWGGGQADQRWFWAYAREFWWKASELRVEWRLDAWLAQMDLTEKTWQMMLVDHRELEDDTLAHRPLGGLLLMPGLTGPSDSARIWADRAEAWQTEIQAASSIGAPLLIATDAVHGHNNLWGATIFPHNIGLGAAGDPDLMRAIGEATRLEVAATGSNWMLSPTVAVARDPRWGRTYESFGAVPERLEGLVGPLIEGLQAPLPRGEHLLATAKHYIADGGTTFGTARNPQHTLDQGNAEVDEGTLRTLHLPPYIEAIEAGVETIMASFSSWNGEDLHAHRYLLTDLLKEELRFTGILVSDLAGILQVAETASEAVELSVAAGIDMLMHSTRWEEVHTALLDWAEREPAAVARIDDAVRRILRVKVRSGLFDQPFPDRDLVDGGWVRHEGHRDLARAAVAASAVLLKNNGVLPLSRDQRIAVVGVPADDIGLQSGGWTITWTGSAGPITPGVTILEGIRAHASDPAAVTYFPTGQNPGEADVAVAVMAELPYAEFQGDVHTLVPQARDTGIVTRFGRNYALPKVLIILSGRPLELPDELFENYDAVIAAWLPGTEGDGLAQLLFGVKPFTGTLAMPWPAADATLPLLPEDSGPDARFEIGHGLTRNEGE